MAYMVSMAKALDKVEGLGMVQGMAAELDRGQAGGLGRVLGTAEANKAA